MELYHYTNINSRNSIILNKELWLSKSSGDNLEPFMKINRGFREYTLNEKYKHLVAYYDIFESKIIPAIRECLNNCYYISFRTERFEDYPMFQNFCKLGGKCIEFDYCDISSSFKIHSQYHKCFHDFVKYVQTTPMENMFDLLEFCYNDSKIKFIMDNNLPPNEDMFESVLNKLLFIKHKSFENEKEYRFVVWRKTGEPTLKSPVKIQISDMLYNEYDKPCGEY